MSTHHQFIFPRYPNASTPDWKGLETRLLDESYLLEPRGLHVPRDALNILNYALASLKPGSYQHDRNMRTTGDVIECYQMNGHLPACIPVRHNDTMSETLALLAGYGVVLDRYLVDLEQSSWCSQYYCLGPASRECLNIEQRAIYDDEPAGISLVMLAYNGSKPYVGVGENLIPPCIPGLNEPLEELPPFGSYVDFIGAAYEDLSVRWRAPHDGSEYYIFDLDWDFSLAMGFRIIRINGLNRESTESLAREIGYFIDQPMRCSHRHL